MVDYKSKGLKISQNAKTTAGRSVAAAMLVSVEARLHDGDHLDRITKVKLFGRTTRVNV